MEEPKDEYIEGMSKEEFERHVNESIHINIIPHRGSSKIDVSHIAPRGIIGAMEILSLMSVALSKSP